MNVKKIVRSAIDVLERKPWLPSAVFLASLLLSLLFAVLLLANSCDSSFRFLPDYSDWLILFLGDSAGCLWFFAAPVLALVMFVLPVAMLCSARCRFAGLKMLTASFFSLWAGILLWVLVWFVALCNLDQMEIARENLERKAEAERTGQTTYVRKKIPRLRRSEWVFGNKRYRIYLKETAPDRYWLIDEYWRYRMWEGRFDSRILLDDVVRWEKRKGGLSLETVRGKCYELDFESGRLTSCPSKEKGGNEK